MRSAHVSVLAVLALGLTMIGCGERTPDDDEVCPAEKPKAYKSKPLFSSCDEIRTNEGVTDPTTGKTERIHRYFHCCP